MLLQAIYVWGQSVLLPEVNPYPLKELIIIIINFISAKKPYKHVIDTNHKQDSQAIQNTSEVVNDTILKYIKTVIICFG